MSEIFADRLFNGMKREEPAAGKLLVAAPGMQSTAFSRTVVLLLEHDANTTFGVDLAHRGGECAPRLGGLHFQATGHVCRRPGQSPVGGWRVRD